MFAIKSGDNPQVLLSFGKMSETSQVPPPIKAQRPTGVSGGMVYTTLNKSPTKQAFSTLKNFLKSKSSITDLRMWSDCKKDDVKEYPGFPEPLPLGRLHESKSSTRLSDFKLKVPRRKRSLGCLVPPSQGEHSGFHQIFKHEYPNSSSDSVHDIKSFIVPIPASQKFNSVASSSQSNITRNSSSLTKDSNKNTSPTRVAFSLDGSIPSTTYNGYNTSMDTDQTQPSTPSVSDSYAFSKEWVAPNTIRGTYLHDWTTNASPRSLTESLKVGKVETPSLSVNQFQVQTPTRNHHGNPSISSIGQTSTSDKVLLSSHSSLPEAGMRVTPSTASSNSNEMKSKLRLDLRDLSKPSNPHPSPCTIDSKQEPILKLGEPLVLNTKPSESISKSESTSESDTTSISSRHSQCSQFSFLPIRTPSIRFYKSNEQIALEKAMDDDRLDRIKFKEFLGTSEDIENDLLDMCSNAKVTDGLDEAVNYIDYEEEDDTDVLFNRDLFGLCDDSGPKGLGLELDDDEFAPKSAVLEVKGEGINGGYDDGSDYDNDEEEGEETPIANDFELYDYTPRANGLELDYDEIETNTPSLHRTQSHKSLSLMQEERCLSNRQSLKNATEQEEEDKHIKRGKDEKDIGTLEELDRHKSEIPRESSSSKDILQMLNNNATSLVFMPQSQEIKMQHQPSASVHRHRSLKFHHLCSNIEDVNYFDKETTEEPNLQDQIWEDVSALDEVNLIPEDYEYDSDYESAYDDRIRYDRKKSVKDDELITPEATNNDDFDFGVGVGVSKFNQTGIGNEPHLWKKLIKTGFENSSDSGTRNRNIQHVERIQLDNRTITLFNCPREEGGQEVSARKDERCSGNNANNEGAGLSIIME